MYRILFAICAALTISACSSPMPAHTASVGSIKALRQSSIQGVAVGSFKLAEGKPENIDQSIASRSQTLVPQQGSISGYLRDALSTELKAAGKLDPDSAVSVSGELTQSELNTNMGTADGTLGARFSVQGGAQAYEKELSVRHQWESSFVGAIAIPKALQEYMALYEKLLRKLFSDPDFVNATQPAAK